MTDKKQKEEKDVPGSATGSLTEEEEDEIWAKSVDLWKSQKAERIKDREEKMKLGIPVKTEDEFNSEWQSHPIFMQSLPDNTDGNEHLAALQSIVDDTTPEEQVDTFKELGNDFFKAGKTRYKDALHYYNRALNVKSKDMDRNSIVLSNRAAVNLELGNYGQVVKDCKVAIEFNPKNSKAHFRLIRGLIALSKINDAIEAANNAIQLYPDQCSDFEKLLKSAVEMKEKIEKRERDRLEEERKKEESKLQLSRDLWKKGYRLGGPIMDLDRYTYQSDRKITIDKDGLIHFPSLFLYPEFSQSDFIMDFQEGQSCGDHLSMMFPPETDFAPWDTTKTYTIDNLEIYFETNWTKPLLSDAELGSKQSTTKRWIRVKHTTAIETILSHKEYIIPRIPIFYVVCKGTTFYNTFLKNK